MNEFLMDNYIYAFSDFLLNQFATELQADNIESIIIKLRESYRNKDALFDLVRDIFNDLPNWIDFSSSRFTQFIVYYFKQAGIEVKLKWFEWERLNSGRYFCFSGASKIDVKHNKPFVLTQTNLEGIEEFHFGAWAIDSADVPSTAKKISFGRCGIKEIKLNGSMNELYLGSCIYLTEVVIPEGLEKLNYFAFGEDVSLTKVVLPKSIEYIDSEVFDTTNFEQLEYTGTMQQWKLITKHRLWRKGSGIKSIKCSDGIIKLK